MGLMGKKKSNLLVIWILGLFVCAMLQVPVWGMVLGSAAYAVLILLLRLHLSIFWAGYFVHGIWEKPEAALKLYDFAYTHGARAGAPMIAYAMLLMERFRYAEALSVLQEVQNRRDLNQKMRLVSRQDLAIAREKTGNIAAAIEEMEKIRQEYECLGSDFYGTLAYFYIQAGEYRKAEEINELSRTEDEGSGAYYDNLALIAYHQKKPEQAEALFQKALELDAAMVSPRYYLGLIAAQKGDFSEAARYFQQVHDSGITGLNTVSAVEAEEEFHRYCKETREEICHEV